MIQNKIITSSAFASVNAILVCFIE